MSAVLLLSLASILLYRSNVRRLSGSLFQITEYISLVGSQVTAVLRPVLLLTFFDYITALLSWTQGSWSKEAPHHANFKEKEI